MTKTDEEPIFWQLAINKANLTKQYPVTLTSDLETDSQGYV